MVYQFSVFLPNRVGQLRDLVKIFAGQGVHIVGLDVMNAVEWAVVRVIFTDAGKARELLKKGGMAFTECAMLAVELPSPDALAGMAAALLSAEVNLHLAYPLLIGARNHSVVAVQVDDLRMAAEVLGTHKFHLLDESDLWPDSPAG